MSWELVKLGELITESRIPSENPDPDRRITVRLNVLGVEKRALENEKAGATKQFIRKAGQFIYGKQNFHKGAFGIIPVELDGFESSADLPSFDVREDCLSEWIFYFFKQGGYYLELAKIARGVATQRIHPEQIYDLEIPLPDIETQKKIIASIKSIEDKGDKLNKELSYQLTLVEQLNQAILQEAVQGKLVPQDPNDEPASELLKRIKAEKLNGSDPSGRRKKEKPLPPIKPEEIPFDIPENWVWCRLGEITDIQRGSSPRPKGDPRYFSKSKTNFNWITISDISNFCENNVLIQTREFLTEEGSKHSRYVDVNEFIIAVSGSTTGKCCITGIEGFIYDGLAVAKIIDNSFDARYLLNYMMCLYTTINNSKTGASFPNINTDYLNSLIFPLPPIKEQKRINKEIEKQFAKTKQLKEHILANQAATEQLLKALLHQVFEVK
jgi:restriction endonuclease S subunit